jgi:hypothetical protein
MRVHATCDHCGRKFLFFQLYNADPGSADRCPHCSRHLNVLNVRPLARGVDRAAAQLIHCLNELAARDPKFRVDPDSLLGPIRDALAPLTAGEDDAPPETARPDNVHHLRWPWQHHRQPAA